MASELTERINKNLGGDLFRSSWQTNGPHAGAGQQKSVLPRTVTATIVPGLDFRDRIEPTTAPSAPVPDLIDCTFLLADINLAVRRVLRDLRDACEADSERDAVLRHRLPELLEIRARLDRLIALAEGRHP